MENKHFSIIIVLIVLIIYGLATTFDYTTKVNADRNPIIRINAESQHFIFDNGQLSSAFDLPTTRVYISGNENFHAFASSTYNDRYIEIIIVDKLLGTELIIIPSIHMIHLIDINFIENAIAVTGYINPSLEMLEIFCLENGKLISQRTGIGFTFDDNGILHYIQVAHPHFSHYRGNDRIVNEFGDILYKSDSSVSIMGKLIINEHTIEFFEDCDNYRTHRSISR